LRSYESITFQKSKELLRMFLQFTCIKTSDLRSNFWPLLWLRVHRLLFLLPSSLDSSPFLHSLVSAILVSDVLGKSPFQASPRCCARLQSLIGTGSSAVEVPCSRIQMTSSSCSTLVLVEAILTEVPILYPALRIYRYSP
jgi:hypothetical protein